jgi:hypothetical protein
LTVKTEANGEWGLVEYISKGSLFLWALRSSLHRRPSTNYFFPHRLHYFTSFVPIVQQAGQAVVPRRLSLDTCLCLGQGHVPRIVKMTPLHFFSVIAMGHFSRIPPKASTATGVYLHSSLLIFFLLDLLWRHESILETCLC